MRTSLAHAGIGMFVMSRLTVTFSAVRSYDVRLNPAASNQETGSHTVRMMWTQPELGERHHGRGEIGWERLNYGRLNLCNLTPVFSFMTGMVLSASTTVLADSTIRLTTIPTTPSVRRAASVRATASKPSPLQRQSRTRCRE